MCISRSERQRFYISTASYELFTSYIGSFLIISLVNSVAKHNSKTKVYWNVKVIAVCNRRDIPDCQSTIAAISREVRTLAIDQLSS